MADANLDQIKSEMEELLETTSYGVRDDRALQMMIELLSQETSLKKAVAALTIRRQMLKPRWQREYEISVEKLTTANTKRKAMRMI